jgi:hypothetical protein
MSQQQAQALAVRWWGLHAEAVEIDIGDDRCGKCVVGLWSPELPQPDKDYGDNFPEFSANGSGHTWEAAFRDADRKRWTGHLVTRRATMKRRLLTR